MSNCEQCDRFFIQSETVRGEPRVHYVSSRSDKYVSEPTTDRRKAERDLKRIVKQAAELTAAQWEGRKG